MIETRSGRTTLPCASMAGSSRPNDWLVLAGAFDGMRKLAYVGWASAERCRRTGAGGAPAVGVGWISWKSARTAQEAEGPHDVRGGRGGGARRAYTPLQPDATEQGRVGIAPTGVGGTGSRVGGGLGACCARLLLRRKRTQKQKAAKKIWMQQRLSKVPLAALARFATA